jgi:S-DNA-T family DNA segregation ATPase FtsK/SpoIIIE
MHVVAMVDGAASEVTIEFDPEHGTVGELVTAMTGRPSGILTDNRFLAADTPLSEAGLRQGATLRLADAPESPARADGVVELRSVGGLTAGRTVRLPSGDHIIGRSGADVELTSTTVSPRHAQLEIAADGTAAITDLGSRNGTAVESYLLPGRCILEDGQVVQVGAVRLSVARPATADVPVLGPPRRNGTVTFNRPPRSVARLEQRPIVAPAAFREPGAGVRFSWMAVAMPAAFGIGMGILVNPTMALFALLSPVMAVSNYTSDKKRLKKQRAAGLEEQEQSVDEFRLTLIRRRTLETLHQRAALPDPAEVVRRATAPSTRLWERRAAHDDFLRLSIGTANLPWEPAMTTRSGSFGEAGELPAGAAELLSDLGHLPFVPVPLDLSAGHTVGLVGDRAAALAVMRSLVCQATVHQGPVDLRLAVLTDPGRQNDWEWAKWLPHTQSLDETLGRRMLAATPEDIDAVLSELLTKPDTNGSSGIGSQAPTGPTTLVVVDVPGLTEGRNSPARELLGGAGQPVCGIVYAASVDRLPAVCTSIVELSGTEGLARFREPGANLEIPDVLVSGVPTDLADQTARALAGLEDPEIATVGADLPDRASLITLLDLDPTPDTMLGRWRAAGQVPPLAAPIGVAETGPLVVDLVTDGPHGLIAGTTGAGKSELLRTLVASLAANAGPEHLNFLLIDYKGGSAFAQCATLPHTVGMVTDLDEHLGQRALRCLEAELRYREHRLREAGASDLKEYLLQGNKEPLPRLVVVIDEFATMVAELPDFIDSLVGVAQRGRSLGVHMILATQRPAGATCGWARGRRSRSRRRSSPASPRRRWRPASPSAPTPSAPTPTPTRLRPRAAEPSRRPRRHGRPRRHHPISSAWWRRRPTPP